MPTNAADLQAAKPAVADSPDCRPSPVNPFAEFAEMLKGYGDPQSEPPLLLPISRLSAEVVFAAESAAPVSRTGDRPAQQEAPAEKPVTAEERLAPRNAGRLLADRLAVSTEKVAAAPSNAPPESRPVRSSAANTSAAPPPPAAADNASTTRRILGGLVTVEKDGGANDDVHITLNIGRRR